jgi:rubredoxin
MRRRLVCCDCGHEFDEAEGEPIEETLSELQDSSFCFVECFCPNCGGDNLEDTENLQALREMKGHGH